MNNKYANVRYWDATQSTFQYPETNTQDPLCYTPITTRPNSGICISGGGSVSASLIAGYFNALYDLGLMNQIRYISGVSGGTWGSTPFCYLPGSPAAFWGNKFMPALITTANMQDNTAEGSMTYAATHADIVDLTLKNILPIADEAYEKAVGDIFLHPFGIKSPNPDLLAARQFFTTNAAAAQNIISRNSGMDMSSFMLMAPDMPYLIMNATMFVPNNSQNPKDNSIYAFEFTPLYSGMRASHPASLTGQQIGGAYVETYAFNSQATGRAGQDGNEIAATADVRFELCQPVGTSGAAPEEMMELDARLLLTYFPNFEYWNPLESGTPQTQSYNFGDGGIIEDTGVVPLLARGVQQIAVFLTEPVLFPGQSGEPGPEDAGFEERAFGYNQIACLFGAQLIDVKASQLQNQVVYTNDVFPRQVFDNSSNDFKNLISALQTARGNGGPVTSQITLNVIANTFFGVTGGYSAEIMWVAVDNCHNWTNALVPSVQQAMQVPEYQDFPMVKVFDQNRGHVIELTTGQANQLGNIAYWMVMQNSQSFVNLLQGNASSAK